MPPKFTKCVRQGGRVRTKKLGGRKYIHLCFPSGGGKAIAGEVKRKKARGARSGSKKRK